MATALRQSGAVAISGSFVVAESSYLKSFLFRTLQAFFIRLYRILFGHWWLNGFNFGIYKNAYDRSGGFDPELNAQEDIALSMQVAKLGRIHYAPEIKVFFSGRRLDRGVIRGGAVYLLTFLQFYFKKNKKVYMDDPR